MLAAFTGNYLLFIFVRKIRRSWVIWIQEFLRMNIHGWVVGSEWN
jgi:hypothetical protein